MSVPKRRAIWVVDDNALDATATARLFEQDHTVRLFADGSAVLEALTSEARPDLMILDWIMPGISGVDVCRFLRGGVTGTEGIAILLLTAHKNQEHIVEGFSAGVNDYLAKPYSEAELRARVGALLRSIELRERAERAEAANRLLLEHAPDALIIVDANRQLCFVNEAAVQTFDMSSEHLLGLRLEELLPSLDVSRPSDVEIGSRVFSPSARVIPDDGRIALLLHDVTHRRVSGPRKSES